MILKLYKCNAIWYFKYHAKEYKFVSGNIILNELEKLLNKNKVIYLKIKPSMNPPRGICLIRIGTTSFCSNHLLLITLRLLDINGNSFEISEEIPIFKDLYDYINILDIF